MRASEVSGGAPGVLVTRCCPRPAGLSWQWVKTRTVCWSTSSLQLAAKGVEEPLARSGLNRPKRTNKSETPAQDRSEVNTQ